MKLHFQKQGILISTLIIISILATFIFSSCNKEDMDNKTDINDNYYIKYIISSNYPRIFSNWSVSTPEGNYTKNGYQTRGWKQTYGPVKKGFNCEVQVRNGDPTIDIYVSKNEEPFALKKTIRGMKLSYTIDF